MDILKSTGVDVSFDVFRSLLDKLDDTSEKFTPIYIIHDAIVLDISESALRELSRILEDGILVEQIGCKFPLKIETIRKASEH